MKWCPQCGKEQPLDEFYNDKSRPDGKQSLCKTHFKEAVSKSRAKNLAQFMFSSARKNARSRGIEFTMTVEWFQERLDAGVCELTGIRFVLGEKWHPCLPSPDRIDSDGPYSPENCRMVLWMINTAKGVMGEKEFIPMFIQVADALREKV